MKLKPRLSQWFRDYENYHRHPANKRCHFVGVPLIMMSLLGLLDRIFLPGPVTATLAQALMAAVLLWALTLDWKFSFLFAGAVAFFYGAGRTLPPVVNGAVFIAGWVFQLVGHYKYEKNSPALAQNLLQTFIGPMWILAKTLRLT